tara:strand:+ start:39 stop:596 length:558 start_codon:yes stop_codon:yes gene_type:complete
MKSSPLNELTAQDIVRKKIKMQKIKDQMNPEHEAYRPGAQKKLAEKHHKTKYQIDTGKRGRPTSLRNEEWLAGPSRKSSSPVNNLTEGDEIVSSAEGSANYRKSALNMLGVNNDSIAAVKAWDKMKSGYLKKPGGENEWNMEKNEFYYDTNKSKMRLIPTDDGEVQDEDFKSKLKSYQLPPIDNK